VRCSGSDLVPTNTERVIETLRRSPGLDDDELARQAGVGPREVQLICRYLVILGRLRRTPGPDGKILNSLIGS
jgi:hypothetical protein